MNRESIRFLELRAAHRNPDRKSDWARQYRPGTSTLHFARRNGGPACNCSRYELDLVGDPRGPALAHKSEIGARPEIAEIRQNGSNLAVREPEPFRQSSRVLID